MMLGLTSREARNSHAQKLINSSLVQPGSILSSVGYENLPVSTNIRCSSGYWLMTSSVHETS